MKYKQLIMQEIFVNCQISIIFVADKQQGYSFHHWGNKRIKKANETILKPLEMIEFL